ncbi:hypothetical protein LUZ60_009051 [Juncus effusus]|nr:hypothetical protein LUZ60_009051 [Juncus effusus]
MSPAMSMQMDDQTAERPPQPPEKPVEVLLSEVLDPQKREEALHHLSERRHSVPDFALLIWYTPCIISLILQVVAADTRVRSNFLKANIPQYLYPFMLAEIKSRNFEYLRLTSLGVIGYLIRAATLIMQKILSTEFGLSYICDKADRFCAVNKMLASMVTSTEDDKLSARLLKHVVSCYLLVSNHPRVAECLYEALPDLMKDGTIHRIFQDDSQATEALQELLWNIKGRYCANGKGKDKVKM